MLEREHLDLNLFSIRPIEQNNLCINSNHENEKITSKCLNIYKHKEFHLNMTLEDVIKICTIILEKIANISECKSKSNMTSRKIFSVSQVNSDLISDSAYDSNLFNSSDLFDRISLYDYIKRMAQYLDFDKYILILSMMLLDKFFKNNNDLTLTRYNYHRVFFICVMETNKFYDDKFINNKTYSLIGGINIRELLLLEIEFLSKIDWNLNIEEDNFYNYSLKLEKCFYKP